MKSVPITEARRHLAELVTTPQTVEITNRGRPVGSLRVFAQAARDPERAKAAAERIAELSKQVRATTKPSKQYGATALVRKLRDDGE